MRMIIPVVNRVTHFVMAIWLAVSITTQIVSADEVSPEMEIRNQIEDVDEIIPVLDVGNTPVQDEFFDVAAFDAGVAGLSVFVDEGIDPVFVHETAKAHATVRVRD